MQLGGVTAYQPIGRRPEVLNADTKLYIVSCTKSKKHKLVNITSSPQTNGHN